jgi:PEP-CTERM motif
LNWVPPFLTNHKFYLVDPNAAAGVASNDPFASTLGTVLYSNGTQTMGNFGFDLTVDPNNPGPFVFAGSLALYNQLPNPDAPVNLDVADFLSLTTGTGTPALNAGYRTNVLGGGVGEFWAGSTGSTTVQDIATPEPASMLLLGSGLLTVVARRRRARRS